MSTCASRALLLFVVVAFVIAVYAISQLAGTPTWSRRATVAHADLFLHLCGCCQVEMDFKAECTAGDQIECFGMPLTDCANGNGSTQQFLHLLRKGGTDVEVWRARTTWKPRGPVGAASAVADSAASVVSSSSRTAAPCSNGVSSSSPAHVNGKRPSSEVEARNGSKSSATCSRTECSNTKCSNNPGKETAAAGDASTSAGVGAAAVVVASEAPEPQPAAQQQEADESAAAALPAKKKGWFGLW